MKAFSFYTDDAMKYGVNAAVILYNFRYWLMVNKAKGTNKRDGKFWVYYSTSSLSEIFPFFTKKQIDIALSKLIGTVLIKGNYNKTSYDRTCWYAYKEEEVELSDVKEGIDLNDEDNTELLNPFPQKVTSISPKREMDFPKRSNGFSQKGEPIPNINTDIKKNNKKIKSVEDEDSTVCQKIMCSNKFEPFFVSPSQEIEDNPLKPNPNPIDLGPMIEYPLRSSEIPLESIQIKNQGSSKDISLKRKEELPPLSGKSERRASATNTYTRGARLDAQANCHAQEVIDYLNKKTGRKFEYSDSNLRPINALLKKYPLEAFKQVIDRKTDDWLNNPTMHMYLRPKTLFRASNFESYINAIPPKEANDILILEALRNVFTEEQLEDMRYK